MSTFEQRPTIGCTSSLIIYYHCFHQMKWIGQGGSIVAYSQLLSDKTACPHIANPAFPPRKFSAIEFGALGSSGKAEVSPSRCYHNITKDKSLSKSRVYPFLAGIRLCSILPYLPIRIIPLQKDDIPLSNLQYIVETITMKISQIKMWKYSYHYWRSQASLAIHQCCRPFFSQEIISLSRGDTATPIAIPTWRHSLAADQGIRCNFRGSGGYGRSKIWSSRQLRRSGSLSRSGYGMKKKTKRMCKPERGSGEQRGQESQRE